MSISELLDALNADPWRASHGFSPDIEAAHADLLAESDNDRLVARLMEWLSVGQPCRFGRIAANRDLLSVCVLTEADLARGDAHVRQVIAAARMRWHAATYTGRKHGFIVWLVSQRVASALPDECLMQLALRICSLYLLRDVEPDAIHHEDVFLELPTRKGETFVWKGGVNFFGSQGDGRWWHDHRFPAGVAFSVNSVGQMVAAARTHGLERTFADALSLEGYQEVASNLTSLKTALTVAMQTIDSASDACSGKATELRSTEDAPPEELQPLPPALRGRDWRSYTGYYHTDFTVPRVYFRQDVERPPEVEPLELDFTYLYDDAAENLDHFTMARGVRIRQGAEGRRVSVRPAPRIVDIADAPLLQAALRAAGRGGAGL
ncbi:MAG: hypothetical protein KDB73_09700 [Planctomycetes bacterium]|nr:hypothetical protein [Planctomycetota bacterium]